MATDPVCGMTVSPDTLFRHLHDGQTYLFCSAKCLAKFQASPADYLSKPSATEAPQTAPVPVRGGPVYTCPMHPEIRQPAPGS